MRGAFPGGIHPNDHKAYAKDAPITDAPVPALLIVPLCQHLGKPATPTVKAGDVVRRGQLIGQASGFISAAVHSPVSGKVKRLAQLATSTGGRVEAVEIENDGQDAWAEGANQPRDAAAMDSKAIREAVAEAGIVGMGGATFPTHVKLSPPENKPIDTVILNGAECEPYLTADHRLMIESPGTIAGGLALIMKAVGAKQGVVGIEANKPDALAFMKKALAGFGESLSARLFPVMYPQGAEKQLIYACLGREVPSGGLPMDAGVVVQNVGTAHAIHEACRMKRPLTERITTVTGPGVDRPGNFRVRLGTPLRVLLEACGYREAETRKLILGGPMMGHAIFDPDLVVSKGVSGILALTEVIEEPHRDCIRCGRCVDHCPMRLLPSQISILAEAGEFLGAREFSVLDCIECGVCTYVCPARRPIVHWVRVCKAEVAKAKA